MTTTSDAPLHDGGMLSVSTGTVIGDDASSACVLPLSTCARLGHHLAWFGDDVDAYPVCVLCGVAQ